MSYSPCSIGKVIPAARLKTILVILGPCAAKFTGLFPPVSYGPINVTFVPSTSTSLGLAPVPVVVSGSSPSTLMEIWAGAMLLGTPKSFKLTVILSVLVKSTSASSVRLWLEPGVVLVVAWAGLSGLGSAPSSGLGSAPSSGLGSAPSSGLGSHARLPRSRRQCPQ